MQLALSLGMTRFNDGTPPEVLGRHYVDEIEKRGEKARFFITNLKDDVGYAIVFDLG